MRSSGILMHITSLPGPFETGTLGKEAYEFVNFLFQSGQKLWQVLPICPAGCGNSPYQTSSCFAYNSLFIDYRFLEQEGLLLHREYETDGGKDFADYEKARRVNEKVLHLAFERFQVSGNRGEYEDFNKANEWWLENYCKFMSLRDHFGHKSWNEWDDWAKFRENNAIRDFAVSHANEIEYHRFVQYTVYRQWRALKNYANSKDIKMIGDLPIYVSYDSADVWANPELFCLDGALRPTEVAGCPPDCYSETGQLWGNPLYDWDAMSRDRYAWWLSRMRQAAQNFDVVRLDHFRGFESYYAIPAGDATARNGRWRKGPGMYLFEEIKRDVNPNVIAEDLGYLTEDVKKLLRDTGYPGMKILQFAFDACGGSDYLPHNHIKNCVVYTGTHDNDTLAGFAERLNERDRAFLCSYLGLSEHDSIVDALIRCAYMSVADTVIIPVQDYLKLSSGTRMNTPSTIGGSNWRFRLQEGMLTGELSGRIRAFCERYQRL